MSEEFTLNGILEKAKCLYKSYEDTFKYIKDYNSKFDTVSNSIDILYAEKVKSYETVLSKLMDNDLEVANNNILKYSLKLNNIRKFTLSEIAHKKLKYIELQIDNPFFFRKTRKDFRKLLNKLNKLDEAAINNTEDFNELKFENIIEHLKNFEYEIEDEKKTGLYNQIAKSTVWGLPILIGFYQLIAMKFFNLNPYFPLAFYAITIFLIYLFLKSISNIKILYSGLMKEKFMLVLFCSPIFAILFVIFIFYYKNLEIEELGFPFILIIIMFILLILQSKFIVEKTKKELVQNELMDLMEKFNINKID